MTPVQVPRHTETLSQYLPSTSTPISAIASLCDICAGRLSFLYTISPVVTASIDRLTVHLPPPINRLLHATATIISRGKTSVTISVTITIHPSTFHTKPILLADAILTFVSIDTTGKPKSITVPLPPSPSSLLISSPFATSASRRTLREIMFTSTPPSLSTDLVRRLRTAAPTRTVKSSLTKIRHRKQFLPRNANHSGMVFGGDVVEAIEEAVVVCTQPLVQNDAVPVIVHIAGLAFCKPVRTRDTLQVEAKVVVTTRQLAVVIVEAWRDGGEELEMAQKAIVYVGMVRNGQMCGLKVGVEVEDGDQDVERAMAVDIPRVVGEVWSRGDDVLPWA